MKTSSMYVLMIVNTDEPENWLSYYYNNWEHFQKVVKRAMIACENSGCKVTYDFPEVKKIVNAGATTKPVLDYALPLCLLSERAEW